jgi:acyl dehydratase
MIDKKHIGYRFPPFTTTVEAGRVRLFCKAIGETNSVHLDADAARAAGYRDIVTPITFPAAIGLDTPNPRAVTERVGVDIAWILHGEEQYEYLAPICVGDRITTELCIVDVHDKKGGELEFIVTELSMVNQEHEPVCKLRRSLVVRRPGRTTSTEPKS